MKNTIDFNVDYHERLCERLFYITSGLLNILSYYDIIITDIEDDT